MCSRNVVRQTVSSGRCGKGSNNPDVRLSLGEADDDMSKAEVDHDNREGRQRQPRKETTTCRVDDVWEATPVEDEKER